MKSQIGATCNYFSHVIDPLLPEPGSLAEAAAVYNSMLNTNVLGATLVLRQD